MLGTSKREPLAVESGLILRDPDLMDPLQNVIGFRK